jgi:hypothetical protein
MTAPVHYANWLYFELVSVVVTARIQKYVTYTSRCCLYARLTKTAVGIHISNQRLQVPGTKIATWSPEKSF